MKICEPEIFSVEKTDREKQKDSVMPKFRSALQNLLQASGVPTDGPPGPGAAG